MKTQVNRHTYHAHGSEGSILLRWQFSPLEKSEVMRESILVCSLSYGEVFSLSPGSHGFTCRLCVDMLKFINSLLLIIVMFWKF